MRLKALGLSLLLLSACAPVPVATPLQAAAPDPGTAARAAPAKKAESAPVLPKQKLTENLLYEFLLAEIAGQRGDLGVATRTYLELARATRDPRVAQRATQMALYARNTTTALEAARLWVEYDPSSVPARQTLAALLVNAGQLAEARPHLEKLLAEEGENLGHGFLQLNALLSRHADRKAVFELVKDLARPYPKVPEAHFALAQAAWNAGEYDEAQSEIRRAEALRPGWELAVLLEGQILRHRSNEQALARYRGFLDQYPKARDVRLAYARLLVTERKYSEARTQFQKLTADFPGNSEVLLAVGLLSLQLQDFDIAEARFKDVLATDYQDKDTVRLYLGQLEEQRGRFDEAAKWYLSVGPGEHYLQAQVKYATLLAKEGKLPEARERLQQLMAQDPERKVQITLAEAQILREVGAYQEAFDLLSDALKKLPENPDLLYDHAMAAEKINRMDILEQNLRTLIKLKPDYAHAYNALGYSLADRNVRLKEAYQLIEHALKLAPDDPFIMDSMGWVKYRMGDLREGLDYLQRAYAARPDPEIAAHLGEVLWVSGNRDQAKKVWDGALKAHPDNKALLDAVRKFDR